MTQLPEGKTRLDLVRAGGGMTLGKRGRLIVSVSKLVEDPKNERKVFRNMEGLIASIKAVGLVEPITVTPLDDRYQIVTGHRRFRAARAAKLEQVEVLIRDPEDAVARRRKSIVSNVQREDIGPVEMAEALQSLMDEDKTIVSQDQLAATLGKSKAWVSGMLRILTLPVELQKKVWTSQQSLSYESVVRIARLEDPRQQEPLIDALLNGASHREIRNQIDTIKGKPAKPNGGSSAATSPQPKRVFHTRHKASVIVQAMGSRLTPDQCVLALKEAVQQAIEASIAEAD
ncbi:MAG TPA: ParB/RepB/Spo0J family partition protein [Tepidisphaeraceae bacterium]|jgi:ParB/RepB/Spo0J family partition protein|nr:ParB/RepB/Spo0J family partition protein [Tepidisphaeraceae bacterium]